MRTALVTAGILFSLGMPFTASPAAAQRPAGPPMGTGTPNQIPLWVGTNTLGNSSISQGSDGSVNVGGTPFIALFGSTSNAADGATGVFGNETASSGVTFGVQGVSESPSGIGVQGSSGNVALAGFNQVCGSAGCTLSAGTAGEFVTASGGTILLGISGPTQQTTSPVFRVDSTGKVFADGGFQSNGADFAESIAVMGDPNKYEAGDLLVIDPTVDRHLALSQRAYSTLVAGIYSTKPGLLGTTHAGFSRNDEIPLAVVGIVPCKVSTENGAIRRGDLLVTSATPGHAMRGTDRNRMLGAVIGKALAPLQKGKGIIQVLITLQ